MRSASVAFVACLVGLAGCSKGKDAPPPGAPVLKIGPKDGGWSQREALEGPMAVWGPAELGKEVLAVTCLPSPRRTLVVTLFAAAMPSGKPATGDLTIRADGQALGVPLSPKEDGAAEARLPVTDALMKSWDGAKDLRFEVKSSPGDGADTGAPSDNLKRVLAACR